MNNKKNNYELFQSKVQNVNKEWIDYNGHMNVAYYTLAFDKALDDFLEKILEIGPTFVEKEKQGPYSLQANYHYLDELRLLDKFFSKIYLIDSDKKNKIRNQNIPWPFQDIIFNSTRPVDSSSR